MCTDSAFRRKEGVRMVKISSVQMKRWMQMEAEHSPNPMKQRRIVMEHIKEHGPNYYPALKRMENKLDKTRRG